MLVILLEKVAKLGQLGDVVTVKRGYARNYLLPRRLASVATKQAVEDVRARRAELEKQQADILDAARARASDLAGITVQLVRRAGIDGRLFGSVSATDVALELKKLGFDFHKSRIKLPVAVLKTVGDVSAEVTLHPEVRVMISVSVLGGEVGSD